MCSIDIIKPMTTVLNSVVKKHQQHQVLVQVSDNGASAIVKTYTRKGLGSYQLLLRVENYYLERCERGKAK